MRRPDRCGVKALAAASVKLSLHANCRYNLPTHIPTLTKGWPDALCKSGRRRCRWACLFEQQTVIYEMQVKNSPNRGKRLFGRDAEPWPRKNSRGAIVGRALFVAALGAAFAFFYAQSRRDAEVEAASRSGLEVERSDRNGAESDRLNSAEVPKPALSAKQTEILFEMGKTSMRPYNCNLNFDDATSAQYGEAFYRLVTEFESASTLQAAHRAGKGIWCQTARQIASDALSRYNNQR